MQAAAAAALLRSKLSGWNEEDDLLPVHSGRMALTKAQTQAALAVLDRLSAVPIPLVDVVYDDGSAVPIPLVDVVYDDGEREEGKPTERVRAERVRAEGGCAVDQISGDASGLEVIAQPHPQGDLWADL